MSKTAHILAIATRSLNAPGGAGMGFGITADPDRIDALLNRSEVWTGPRQLLEGDGSFVQPISYVVLRKGNQVLAYTRGEAGGEARLHAKVSVGLGGHTDAADAMFNGDLSINLAHTVAVAVKREISEEIGLNLPGDYTLPYTHLIQSLASDVDAVHVGLMSVLDYGSLAAADVDLSFEDGLENAEWQDIDDLLEQHEAGSIQLEGWSLMALKALVSS